MINKVKPGVMILLAVFALVYVSEARAVDAHSIVKIGGTWDVSGTWEDHEWTATWTISQSRKKIRGYAYGTIPFKCKDTDESGTWLAKKATHASELTDVVAAGSGE